MLRSPEVLSMGTFKARRGPSIAKKERFLCMPTGRERMELWDYADRQQLGFGVVEKPHNHIHAFAKIRTCWGHKHHSQSLTRQHVLIRSFTKVERETVDMRTSDVAFGNQLKVVDGTSRLALPNC